MTNRRLFAVGLAGIAALVIVGFLAVWVIGSGSRPASTAPVEPPAAAGPPAAPVAASAPSEAARTAAVEAAVAPARRRPSAPVASGWDEVPVVSRPRELGADLARPVADALEAARGEMEPCFREEERALAAGKGPKFNPRDPPTGPAVIVLRLQTRDGGVDVVGTELESRGSSTAALPACCRKVVDGREIAAPFSQPGRRYRLKLVLD